MAILLLGTPIAQRMLDEIRKKAKGKKLSLAVVQVGENTVSETYLKEKQKACEYTGIEFRPYRLRATLKQEKLKAQIRNIARKKAVSGLLIQLPLPKHFRTQEICDAIPLEKDVDVLSSHSFGIFSLGLLPFLPPTVGAVSKLFSEYHISVSGKRVVLVGAGRLVGLPLSIWLLRQRALVVFADSRTKNLRTLSKEADIVISATGQRNLINGSLIKKGAVVVDAGISVEHGVVGGDIDFKSVAQRAKFLTPVPGGVGPLTVACLLENLITLAERKKRP